MNVNHSIRFRLFSSWAWALALVVATGCNTLSSLGLPFNRTSNRLIPSAAQISQEPGVAFDLPRELVKYPIDDYPVEFGDALSIEPVSFDATIRLPGDQIVKPDGTISLGEFGQYYAFGKNILQIQSEVQSVIYSRLASDLSFELDSQATEADDNGEAQKLRDKRWREIQLANRVSVRLVNWDSKVVYVLGEVNSPGSFPYSGNQTVLDAIVAAGGLTAAADGHKIIVTRPTPNDSCRIVLRTCYDQIVQLGDTSTNYQLMPGDRVFVPSLKFIDDLKQTFLPTRQNPCPRCAPPAVGCYSMSDCLEPSAKIFSRSAPRGR